MKTEPTPATNKEKLAHIAFRLTELNNTSSQILIFLSFAIVAAVTFLSPALEASHRSAVNGALHWWIAAIFPTVIGIIPLKELADESLPWYNFLLWMRYVLLWCDVICILIGAMQFFKAI